MKTSSQKLNFALIGAGGISQSQHLPNLQRAPHIYLKTLCDLDEDRLGAVQEQHPDLVFSSSCQEVFEDPEIEAVLIATPAGSHASLAIQALQAGKHVYVEKPLSETEEDCRRVMEAQEKSGRELAVAFNRRMAPAYQKSREILQSHGGGKNIHYRIADSYYIWGKANRFEPGTRIIHEVCHVFDLLRFLTESEVVSIYCVASRDDDETIVLQFANGCVASIMSSGYATYDMPKESMDVIVELGSFTVSDCVELRTYGLDDFDPVYRFAGHTHPDRDQLHRYLFEMGGEESMLQLRKIYYRAWKNRKECPESEFYLDHHAPFLNYMMNKGWLEAVDHFAESILQGKTSQLANARDGLQAARLCQAAIQSREEKRLIFL